MTTSPDSDATLDDATTSDEATTTTGDPTDDSTLGTSSSTTTSDDASFIDTAEDGVWGGDPCDPWAQDCPEGEKCVPYSSDGGAGWNDVKCVPILGDQAPGEPCVYTGVVDATDDCDATSWCFTAEGAGICHSFCTGSLEFPECPAGFQCLLDADGDINVCLQDCDPLVQDCGDDLVCVWTGSNFACVIPAQNLPVGEPCVFANDCELGLQCIEGAVPDCAGQTCCTPFCEVSLGDGQCGALPGTACVAFFAEGEAPPGLENVGLCVVP